MLSVGILRKKICKSLLLLLFSSQSEKPKKGGGAEAEGVMKLAFSTFYFEGFGTNICLVRM